MDILTALQELPSEEFSEIVVNKVVELRRVHKGSCCGVVHCIKEDFNEWLQTTFRGDFEEI